MIEKEKYLNGRKIENRLVFQPMEGCDGNIDGSPSELTIRKYLRFAKSGAGIIWFEAVAVVSEGRANPRQLMLTNENKNSFKELIKQIKQISFDECGYSPVIIMQMTHSGRQSRPIDKPLPIIAAENKFLQELKPLPSDYIMASDDYCKKLPASFVSASRIAKEVGFDGVDVKNCHGYLFNDFLSAYNRNDIFGGDSIENRTRLYFDCLDAVKNAVNDDFIITTRLGVYDGFKYPYGFSVKPGQGEVPDLSEAEWIMKKLKDFGINLVNITIGNPYVNPHVNRPNNNGVEDGYLGVERMREVTAKIKNSCKEMNIVLSAPTYLGEKSMDYANKCLNEGVCDFVGFGRMTLAYPEFYRDYLTMGRLEKLKCCVMCSKCSQMMRAGGVSGCPVRDTVPYLQIYKSLI